VVATCRATSRIADLLSAGKNHLGLLPALDPSSSFLGGKDLPPPRVVSSVVVLVLVLVGSGVGGEGATPVTTDEEGEPPCRGSMGSIVSLIVGRVVGSADGCRDDEGRKEGGKVAVAVAVAMVIVGL
jgi:hypothetical protein